jgi:hypothetical protein
VGRLCGSAEALGGFWLGVLCCPANKTQPRFSLVMTRNDDHLLDAVPNQKLEWVTPKILLMDAVDTDGAKRDFANETTFTRGVKKTDRFYLKPRHTYKNQ